MVRLLLLVTLFLCSVGYAHNAFSDQDCQNHLSGLNQFQVRTLRFVKKLQAEIDRDFPTETHARIGVGRAIGPLVAAHQQAASPLYSMPLDLNWPSGTFAPGSLEETKLFAVFDKYLPSAEALKDKTVVLVMYDETTTPAISLIAMLELYLSSRKIPARQVHLELITRQDRVRWVKDTLAKALLEGRYTVRPLALSNEVRHWFRDALLHETLDFAQFKDIDVLDDRETKIPERKERNRFIRLQEDFGKL